MTWVLGKSRILHSTSARVYQILSFIPCGPPCKLFRNEFSALARELPLAGREQSTDWKGYYRSPEAGNIDRLALSLDLAGFPLYKST